MPFLNMPKTWKVPKTLTWQGRKNRRQEAPKKEVKKFLWRVLTDID
jgi:hypothetical protein